MHNDCLEIQIIFGLITDFVLQLNKMVYFLCLSFATCFPTLRHRKQAFACLSFSFRTFEVIDEYKEKISNGTGAELALSQAGILKNSGETKENGKYFMGTNEDQGASSNNQAAVKRPPTTKLPEKSDGKMPKWFKPSK